MMENFEGQETLNNKLHPDLRNRIFPKENTTHYEGTALVTDDIGHTVQSKDNDSLHSECDELLVKQMKEKIEQLRTNIVDRIDSQLIAFSKEFTQELGCLKLKNHQTNTSDSHSKNPKKTKNNIKGHLNGEDELPEKEFLVRESLLTELLEISHIRTIYHIFVAMLVVLFLQTFLYDLIETGKFNLDYGMILFAFGKIQMVIMTWLCMKLSVILLVFPAFHFWAYNRKYLHSQGVTDAFFLILYVLYMLCFLVLPARIVLVERLPPASSAIILCEQVRLVMKSYAFVRSNVPRAKNYNLLPKKDVPPNSGGNKHSETADSATKEFLQPEESSVPKLVAKTYDSPCPNFSNFLYFLFAPTLIYCDNYPRMTGPIRWRYVTSNFGQVVACLFYTYYIFQRFCVPVFQRFGHEPISYRGLLLSVFGCMMPGALVLIINFYLLLHAWMNAFAEMLRFGDRMFYKDWWNSTTYANYYRTWNIVVHDWLYTYVYRDCYKFFKPNRKLPMALVFFLSALVHEYIVSLMFSYFYPLMLVLFLGMGGFFMFLTDKRKSRFWNIFFWVSLFIGPGIFMSLYCTEIYARTNCSQYYQSEVLDFFVPRSWICYHHDNTK